MNLFGGSLCAHVLELAEEELRLVVDVSMPAGREDFFGSRRLRSSSIARERTLLAGGRDGDAKRARLPLMIGEFLGHMSRGNICLTDGNPMRPQLALEDPTRTVGESRWAGRT